MKRAQIGDISIDLDLPYWTAGKDYYQLRQAEREIYARIDLLQEYANIADSQADVDIFYTQMDILFVVLCVIEAFGNNPESLEKAGIVLSDTIESGAFFNSYSNLDERNDSVNILAGEIVERTNSILLSEHFHSDFIEWYNVVVLQQNYYIIPGSDSHLSVAPDPKNSAIGAVDVDFCAQLKNCGFYYIYLVADSLLVDTTASIYKKQKQLEQLSAIRNAGIGLTEYVMLDNLEAGIIRQTGKAPDAALRKFKQGQDPQIGNPFAIIASIIVAVISLATAVVGAIATIRASDNQRRIAEINRLMSESAVNGQAPSVRDFDGDGIPDAVYNPATGQYEPINKDNSTLTYVALGAGALLLIFGLMN